MSIEYIEYTIRDLSQSPSPLQQFRDPRNFTKPLVGWGLERLRSNPMSRLDDPAVILAIIDNEIIGRLGAFASSTVYEGRRIDTLALSGFDLDETYIKTGAGGVILLRALHWKRPLSVCGGPSANLQRVYERAGFLPLGPLKRYIYFFSAYGIVHRYVHHKQMAVIAAGILQLALRGYYRLRSLRLPGSVLGARVEFVRTRELSSRVIELSESFAVNHFTQPVDVINWAIDRNQLAAFEIHVGGRPVGYYLLRMSSMAPDIRLRTPRLALATLLDYYVDDSLPELKALLLRHAVEFLGGQKVDAFELQLHDEKFEAICKTAGLVQIGGAKVYFRPLRRGDGSAKIWRLTLAAGDVLIA